MDFENIMSGIDMVAVQHWGLKILAALAILIVTHFLAKGVAWGFAKLVDRIPLLQRHSTGAPGATVGSQIGSLIYWLIWLVGLTIALQPLGLSQALTPVQNLTNQVFAYVPRIFGAGLIFFIGLIVARIVRQIVETTLSALNADGWAAKAGLGEVTGNANTLGKTVGTVIFVLIIIPVAIAALQTLGISSISDPATNVLQTILSAIPRIIAAAILLALAFFIARWVAGLVQQILPALGFDNAIESMGVIPATTKPSSVIATVATVAIMLFAAVEATRLMEFAAVSALLVQLIDLGGRVLFGSVIIAAGAMLAGIITRVMKSSTGEGGFASQIMYYAIIALSVAMGLRFMGLANEIVNLAFGLILGSAAVACAIAFGLGGRPTAHKLLERWTESNGVPKAPTPPSAPPAE
jgi:hypothetical protein